MSKNSIIITTNEGSKKAPSSLQTLVNIFDLIIKKEEFFIDISSEETALELEFTKQNVFATTQTKTYKIL